MRKSRRTLNPTIKMDPTVENSVLAKLKAAWQAMYSEAEFNMRFIFQKWEKKPKRHGALKKIELVFKRYGKWHLFVLGESSSKRKIVTVEPSEHLSLSFYVLTTDANYDTVVERVFEALLPKRAKGMSQADFRKVFRLKYWGGRSNDVKFLLGAIEISLSPVKTNTLIEAGLPTSTELELNDIQGSKGRLPSYSISSTFCSCRSPKSQAQSLALMTARM